MPVPVQAVEIKDGVQFGQVTCLSKTVVYPVNIFWDASRDTGGNPGMSWTYKLDLVLTGHLSCCKTSMCNTKTEAVFWPRPSH